MNDASTHPRPRRFAWPLAFVLVALIAAALVALIFLRIENWPARTVRDLRAAFIDVAHLQPKITIKNRVYLEQTSQTAELATVVRKTEIEHEFLQRGPAARNASTCTAPSSSKPASICTRIFR